MTDDEITILDDGGNHLTVVSYGYDAVCVESTMDSYTAVCFASKAEAQRVIDAITIFLPRLPEVDLY